MRIRITFSKTGSLIFIGNRDLLTIWERSARRAGLALTYSQAFHPQPKIHLAAPLPLGFSSRGEVLDMQLNDDISSEVVAERLQAALPAGIAIRAVDTMEAAAPALQADVESAEYEVSLPQPVAGAALRAEISALLAAASLPRQRRGKAYDLRPLIEGLRLLEDERVWMRLSSREGATGRPDEVLDALGVPRSNTQIERTGLIFRSPTPKPESET